MPLKQSTLWRSIVETTGQALSTGALIPIPTEYRFLEDQGVRFFVRVLASLRRKDEERKKQTAPAGGGKRNPFLPPEKDLVVADLTETHLAVLNKFNVVEHHLLIITRHFEDQETLLTPADFDALWHCMVEFDGLGFYNGGREAGASQEHKHLQMVPLPMTLEGPVVPVQPLLDRAAFDQEGFGRVPGFDFRHAFVRLDPATIKSSDWPRIIFELYGRMLKHLGMQPPSYPYHSSLAGEGQRERELPRQSGPYCLLVTRGWMLLVPRSREHFEDVSFNSLAYAGSLFVRDEKQLERVKSFGPMQALKSAAVPW